MESGRITFLSFRQQNQSVDSATSGFYGSYGGVTTTTTYTYFIRASVSTVILSADPAGLDASSLGTALEDPDWGIRHYAVKVLTGGKIEIDGDTAALIGRMSVEDPVASVRVSGFRAEGPLRLVHEGYRLGPGRPLLLPGGRCSHC